MIDEAKRCYYCGNTVKSGRFCSNSCIDKTFFISRNDGVLSKKDTCEIKLNDIPDNTNALSLDDSWIYKDDKSITRLCLSCGFPFVIKLPSTETRRRYCTIKCNQAYRRGVRASVDFNSDPYCIELTSPEMLELSKINDEANVNNLSYLINLAVSDWLKRYKEKKEAGWKKYKNPDWSKYKKRKKDCSPATSVDLTGSLSASQIDLLNELGVVGICRSGYSFTEKSDEVQHLARMAERMAVKIKLLLGLNVSDKQPVKLIGYIVRKLGFSLKCKRVWIKGKRVSFYSVYHKNSDMTLSSRLASNLLGDTSIVEDNYPIEEDQVPCYSPVKDVTTVEQNALPFSDKSPIRKQQPSLINGIMEIDFDKWNAIIDSL